MGDQQLADPALELRDASGAVIASNDNWTDASNAQEIVNLGIAPSDNLDSAILTTLDPASYTTIVRGANGGTGTALVEAYDLDRGMNSKLINISTRGMVKTGNDVLIAGIIVTGQHPLNVLLRAVGPSLPLAGSLGNPVMELRDSSGSLIATNDNWRSDQEAAITATGMAPSNDLEAAILQQLAPGEYTAIVSGADEGVGVGLVEAFTTE